MTRIKVREKVETTKELKELELREVEVKHKKDPTKVVATYYAWWGGGFGQYEFVSIHENLEDLIQTPEDFNYNTLKDSLREKCMDKLTI